MRSIAAGLFLVMTAACQWPAADDATATPSLSSASPPRADAVPASAMAVAAGDTVRLRITGMTCASCPFAVRTALRRVPGVKTVDVSYERAEAVVVTTGKADPAALVRAVEAAGFGARPVALRRGS